VSEREPQPLLVLAEFRCTTEGDAALREHAARGLLAFDEWNPAGRRGGIDAPVLLIASRADRFVPFPAVESYAAATLNASLVEIQGDHFDVYASPVRERAADLAAAFLARELAPTR
jgi:pimeloyl-ACP methyl ester carboxylesterase